MASERGRIADNNIKEKSRPGNPHKRIPQANNQSWRPPPGDGAAVAALVAALAVVAVVVSQQYADQFNNHGRKI